MVSFDYSLKLSKLSKDKSFPHIVFPGVGGFSYNLVPYSAENIHDTRQKRSSLASVNNYDDRTLRDKGFKFVEGFNNVSFSVDLNNEDDTTVTPYSYTLKDLQCVLTLLPEILAYDSGQFFAVKNQELFDKGNYAQSISGTKDYTVRPYNANDSLVYASRLCNNNSHNGLLFSRSEIIGLFRKKMTDEQFMLMLPIIELFANNIRKGRMPLHSFMFFTAMNDFLEHGKNTECFIDFFLNEDNARNVSTQYNELTFNVYGHTKRLIDVMVSNHHIFNDFFVSNSAFRKVVSEREQNVLFELLNITIPMPDLESQDNSSVAMRVRKMFDTIEATKELSIPRLTIAMQLVLVDDIVVSPRGKQSRSNNIENFFEDFLAHRNADEEIKSVIHTIISQIPTNLCNFLIRIVENDHDNKFDVHHIAVLAYILKFPGAINEHSAARLAFKIQYALEKTDYNIDYVTDTIVQMILNFNSDTFSTKDWTMIMSYHDSPLPVRHVLNVIATKSPIVHKPHSNRMLDTVIDYYSAQRIVI